MAGESPQEFVAWVQATAQRVTVMRRDGSLAQALSVPLVTPTTVRAKPCLTVPVLSMRR